MKIYHIYVHGLNLINYVLEILNVQNKMDVMKNQIMIVLMLHLDYKVKENVGFIQLIVYLMEFHVWIHFLYVINIKLMIQ